MASSSFESRHPSASEILSQVSEEIPISLGIQGEPACQIRILPGVKCIEVLVENDSSDPEVTRIQSLKASKRNLDGRSWGALTIEWLHSPVEPYLFACSICDRVQLHGDDLSSACDAVLRSMEELLRKERILSREEEVGLFGEIVILLSLQSMTGSKAALDAWMGANGEEHDFALPSMDLEVKSTRSEARTHWISSMRQLLPLPGRPLRLVSVQLTPKVGEGALTLSELAGLSIRRFRGHSRQLTEKLAMVGFHFEQVDVYSTKWALRDNILEFEIADSFPRITPIELQRIGIDVNAVPEVSYRVNLHPENACVDSSIDYPHSLQEF